MEEIKAELQEVKNSLEKKSQEVEDARKSLDLAADVTLNDGLADHQSRFKKARDVIEDSQKLLGVGTSDEQISVAIEKLIDNFGNAQSIIDGARATLQLDNDQDLISAIRGLLNAPEIAEEDHNDEIQVSQATKTKPNITATGDMSTAITEVQQAQTALKDVQHLLESNRGIDTTRSVQPETTTSWHHVSTLIETISLLEIPDEDLNRLGPVTSKMLSRYKKMESKVWDNEGSSLSPGVLEWSLEAAEVPRSKESFEQLICRLRTLVAVEADVPSRLVVIEGLIKRVDKCTLANLVNISDMLLASWLTDGLVNKSGDELQLIAGAKPQDMLQVFHEARSLELLLRGTSVLRSGRGHIASMCTMWSTINHAVIADNLVLQSYEALFNDLDAPEPSGLLENIISIVKNTKMQSCLDKPGGARLIALAFSDGSYRVICEPRTRSASLYPVSDLEYDLGIAITFFPRRYRADGTISEAPPFTEHLTARFVERFLPSLAMRGCSMDR